MSRISQEYERGYRDYVKGFDAASTDKEYLGGYHAARVAFFADIPYDEDLLGGMNW